MRIFLAIPVGVLAILAAAGIYVHMALGRDIRIDAGRLVYEVPRGATIKSLSADLAARDILATPASVFRLYARLTRGRGRLKAGEYQLVYFSSSDTSESWCPYLYAIFYQAGWIC